MMREMTYGADAATSNDESRTGSTEATRLLDLQRVDTESDQLVNRRERLEERQQLLTVSGHLKEWERLCAAMRARIDELTAVIERSESEASAAATDKERLQAQLKTIIVPREAEALMHEITTLDEQIDALDITEIEALEEQSTIDDQLTDHLRAEQGLLDAVRSADLALQRATSEIEAELAVLADERTSRRAAFGDLMLVHYDRVRASSGVAVAQLVGHRCEGCHLDLSAAEVDDVKDEAASSEGVADCPNCGRMLVV